MLHEHDEVTACSLTMQLSEEMTFIIDKETSVQTKSFPLKLLGAGIE